MPVLLSAPSAVDADEFVAAVLASRDLHGPWIDLADTPARYHRYCERVGEPDHAAFLVRHGSCGGLVGVINVNNIIRGALLSGSLGYAAFASHAGRGLMTEGLRAVTDVAFGALGLHRLEANIQPANGRSRRLVRRLGFEKEGLSPRYLLVDGDWRDHERWALLVERWKAPPPTVTATARPEED